MSKVAPLIELANRVLAPANYQLGYTGTSRPRWRTDPEFASVWKSVRLITRLDPPRAFLLYGLVRALNGVPGDLAEAGVYRGGTSRMIADTLHAISSTKSLHLFDTFEGLTVPHPEHDAGTPHRAGEFAGTLGAVTQLMQQSQFHQWTTHPGPIEATTRDPAWSSRRWSLVHLDMDLFEPTMSGLRYFHPRLSPGGVIVGDDYGNDSTPGVTRAFDEFAAEHGTSAIYLPTGQALLLHGAE